MNINSPTLFIEINKLEYIFSVSDIDGNGDFQLIYKKLISIQGIHENKIIDFDLANKIIKENIYLLEQKINFTFKNTIIYVELKSIFIRFSTIFIFEFYPRLKRLSSIE